MARGQKIVCRGFVSSGDGSYRQVESFSPDEKTEFSRWIVDRIGRAEEEFFGLHPEIYAKL